MCTVTWVREADDGYTLCVSRDEKRMRMTADGPRLHRSGGVRVLAPVDRERGGGWLAANEHGVSVCLLNHYDENSKKRLRTGPSRGELVMRLAPSRDREEAEQRLRQLDLSPFEPFTIVCLEPGQPAMTIEWMRSALSGDAEAEERRPLVSSSVAQKEATRMRRELFERLRAGGLTKQTLFDFHSSHEPERGELSPCMHREDAATVSFTTVEVSGSNVRMTYRDGAPCEQGTVSVQCLQRKAGSDVRAA